MRRPRIKYEHLPVRLGDDAVRIGGSLSGIAAVIPDPDGTVWTLLLLLDGTRSVDRVVADLVHRHPDVPACAVRDSLMRVPRVSSIHMRPPPAPQQNVFRPRLSISRSSRPAMDPRTSRGWSTIPL